MGKYTRQWPRPKASPTYTPYHEQQQQQQQQTDPRRPIFGISSRVATYILSGIVFWNLALFILCITVAAVQGNSDWEFPSEMWYHRMDRQTRTRMVFLWCTLPFVALIVSIVDLVRRHTLTVRRAAISAGAGATLYLAAFFLWGDCAYFSEYAEGMYPVCWHIPSWDYFSGDWNDPVAIIFVLPWFALAAALTYATLMVLALLALRRRRQSQNTMAAYRKSISAVELGTRSKEFSELGPSSISEIDASTTDEETLPSRPRSTAPSRQLSMANHSTRPPTYYSEREDSLLTVSEKDEKTGSVGYV